MRYKFYGEKTPCGNGFTQSVITKECSFDEAMRYLENGIVIDDELTRGFRIIEFEQVNDSNMLQ